MKVKPRKWIQKLIKRLWDEYMGVGSLIEKEYGINDDLSYDIMKDLTEGGFDLFVKHFGDEIKKLKIPTTDS